MVFYIIVNRSKTEEITPSIFVLGALDRIWNTSSAFQQSELAALKKAAGNWGRMWSFRRCQINGVVYHSQSYQRVTARNNFTVAFTTDGQSGYGSVLSYAKLQQKCHQASCRSRRHCQCQLNCHYFALIQIFDVEQNQLPELQGRILVQHILKVKETTKLVALPLGAIKEKCLQVAVSSGTFVCHLANRVERD